MLTFKLCQLYSNAYFCSMIADNKTNGWATDNKTVVDKITVVVQLSHSRSKQSVL